MKKIKIVSNILLILLCFILTRPVICANNAIYYYNTGVNCHKQGKIELAIQNYKKALSLDPKCANARYNLIIAYQNKASYYLNKKNYTAAIQNYKNALTLDNKNAEIYYNLGIIYDILGQSQMAIQNYKNALAINPKLGTAKSNMAINYYNSAIDCHAGGDDEKAILNLKQAITINPSYVNAYELLANIYTNSGQINEAIEIYKKLTILSPMNASVFYNLGVAYGIKGQHNLAVLNYQKALNLDPSNADAKYNMDISQREVGKQELAVKINNVQATTHAPSNIYRLVTLEDGLKYTPLVKSYELLDLIWGDPEGQKLLNIISRNNVKIKVTRGNANTNAVTQTKTTRETLTFVGLPIATYDVGTEKITSINLGESYINSLRDPNLPIEQRLRAIEAFIHELCHAAMSTVVERKDNSIEEELSASMIGYNVAHRIIRGSGLTRDEAIYYSKVCLRGLLMDEHRDLQLYNGFNSRVQGLGIYPPYVEEYRNIKGVYDSIKNIPGTPAMFD